MAPEHMQGTELGRGALKESCRMPREILARVGDTWTVLTVLQLVDGPMRFNEIRRRLNGISQRMLTLTLRNLERDGLVTRTVFPSIPPRVDYALTRLGASLSGPVRALGAWAHANEAEIEAARAAFDMRPEALQASARPHRGGSGPLRPDLPKVTEVTRKPVRDMMS